MFKFTNTKALGMIIKKDKLLAVKTGFLKMIVGVLKLVIHNTFEIGVYIYIYIYIYIYLFIYLTEQHSKFLLHTLQVLYMCTLCDSTNINTIIEFVPHKTPSHCHSPPS